MESVLFRQILKIIIIVSVPVSILFLIISGKPVTSVAYLTGIILGIFHLKTLFDYITGLLDAEVKSNKYILIAKYIFSLFLNIGILIITLYKAQIVGFPVLFGIITVPIIITLYAIWKGISLYRKS